MGAAVGTRVGTFEGTAVDGTAVWPCGVGAAVVGIAVGTLVGNAVGVAVGATSRGDICGQRAEKKKVVEVRAIIYGTQTSQSSEE